MYFVYIFFFCFIERFCRCVFLALSEDNGNQLRTELIENRVENLDECVPMNEDTIKKKFSGIYGNCLHYIFILIYCNYSNQKRLAALFSYILDKHD